MASGLSTLTVEIIELIADVLSCTDLLSLRSVSKELNHKTLHYFSCTYLATVQTDLSRKSLQKLQRISETEPFRRHVQILLVETGSNYREQGYDDFKGKFWCPRHPSGYLEASVPGARMLRDILVEGLVNCRSFNVHGYDDSGYPHEPGYLTPSDAVSILSSIVAEANLSIRSFTVRFNGHGTARIDTRRLHLGLYQQPEFRSGWAHLQELFLDYSINWDDCDWAMNLILCATNLQKLALDFYERDIPLVDRLVSLHNLPKLQHLSLSRAYLTVDRISRLLTNSHDSLRELSFRFVNMECGSTWATYFRELRNKFPALESFSVFAISEDISGQCVHLTFPKLSNNPIVPGSEKTTPPKSDRRLLQPSGLPIRLTYKKWRAGMMWFGVSYHGPEMDAILEIMAETVESFDFHTSPSS